MTAATPSALPVYAVIVAGGQGTRMGTAIPKQFLELQGRPVLYHTIKAFLEAIPHIHIILVLPAHQISYAQMVLQAFPDRLDLTIVAGGETRFHSVHNGLNAIDTEEDGIVLIHDGVRAMVSPELICRCYDAAVAEGSAIPVVAVPDSMRLITDNGSQPVDRSRLRIIQTPQTFRLSLILPAFEQVYQDHFTDEATVLEATGHAVHLVAGERSNIKITTPEDLVIAEALLNGK